MVDWQTFCSQIVPSKNEYLTHLIHMNADNQLGLFYKKNETTLFFGFLKSSNDENLIKMIFEMDQYAHRNSFQKIIGPIDGATWNNYRFQFETPISSYPGQPRYAKKICDVFLRSDFKISEIYESVQIKSLDDLQKELSAFANIELPGLRFEKPTPKLLTNKSGEFVNILNEIFVGNYQYEKISAVENQLILAAVEKLINYDLSLVALNQKNEIVGFMLNYVINDTLYIKTIGFKNEYRNQGLSVFKMLETLFVNLKLNANYKITKCIVCLMKKDNFPSLISRFFKEEKNEYVLLEKSI